MERAYARAQRPGPKVRIANCKLKSFFQAKSSNDREKVRLINWLKGSVVLKLGLVSTKQGHFLARPLKGYLCKMIQDLPRQEETPKKISGQSKRD